MARLHGLLPPMVTPFRDREVDPDSIARLVEHTVHHLDGMVVAGSCGEGPSMGPVQRRRALEAYLGAVAGRLPVIAGVAATSLAELRAMLAVGKELGVAAFLVPPPFYYANSPAGLRSFYQDVAQSTDSEVVVYDNPGTTKTVMSVDLLAAVVADNPNVNHVKITDPDLEKVSRLREVCDATLLAGSDEVMHHQVLRGCDGAVTAVPQVFPRESRAWFDTAATRTGAAGRPDYDRLLPFVEELLHGPDQYPAVVKFALAQLGVLASDDVLPPLTPLDQHRRAEVSAVLNGWATEPDRRA